VQRHPDELISKWATAIDNGCHKANIEKIEHYHVKARHIYNMDEKGFVLGVVGRSKEDLQQGLVRGWKEEEHYSRWLLRVDNAAGLHLR
jgi:hypothetical protein